MKTNISNKTGITLGELRKFINEDLKDISDDIKLDMDVSNAILDCGVDSVREIIYGDFGDDVYTLTFYNF